MDSMNNELSEMTREELINEVLRLRVLIAGMRTLASARSREVRRYKIGAVDYSIVTDEDVDPGKIVVRRDW